MFHIMSFFTSNISNPGNRKSCIRTAVSVRKGMVHYDAEIPRKVTDSLKIFTFRGIRLYLSVTQWPWTGPASFYSFEHIRSIYESEILIGRLHGCGDTCKELVVSRPFLAPCNFGKRRKAWQVHVLEMVKTADVLSPCIGLDSLYMLSGTVIELVIRIERVTFLEGDITSDTERLSVGLRVGCLIVVEIKVVVRGHDHIVALFCRVDAALRPSP